MEGFLILTAEPAVSSDTTFQIAFIDNPRVELFRMTLREHQLCVLRERFQLHLIHLTEST